MLRISSQRLTNCGNSTVINLANLAIVVFLAIVVLLPEKLLLDQRQLIRKTGLDLIWRVVLVPVVVEGIRMVV